jgi:signal transduction histidine kinase/CheY-like chemotaxis protein
VRAGVAHRVPAPSGRPARYLLALGFVAGATLLRFVVDPLIHDQIPYFIYVASVVIATWFCGVEAGILSTVVAAFVGNYFFVPPRYEFLPSAADLAAMTMFAVVACGLVWLVGRWREAEQTLRRHAAVLTSQADELRGLHAEAERINRVKDEFLATLSHELRTPLNAIMGWAHVLNEVHLAPERQEEAVRAILRNARSQVRLINDTLDVSRIISGKMLLELRPVDLASIVSSTLDMIRPAAEAKKIAITIALPRDATMTGDADRLQQVAWNLLSNAVKFTPSDGHISVTLERKDAAMRLTVSDDGIGVDPAFRPHLFERFFQADGSTTRLHGGLGLGLALVRHIVELHGGTVSADSRGLGHGAMFTVTLPVRAAAPTVSSEPTADSADRSSEPDRHYNPALAGTRVLIVDDEGDAREILNESLTQFGAEVRTAASTSEGLDIFQQWRPDVLVADIGMPFEDGYELIRRVRALEQRQGGMIPAVAVTAYAQRDDRARTLSAGYNEHLAKPVDPRHLAAVVEGLRGNVARS